MDADVNHHKCNSKRYTKWDHMGIEDKNSKKKKFDKGIIFQELAKML